MVATDSQHGNTPSRSLPPPRQRTSLNYAASRLHLSRREAKGGDWRAASGERRAAKHGEWRAASGEWRAEKDSEWRIANGEWRKMANGE
jgi:hypothetical protein